MRSTYTFGALSTDGTAPERVMDLTHEYLKIKGLTGYLQEKDISSMVMIGYSKAGTIPEYYWCDPAQAEEILRYWEITGEIRTNSFNYETGKFDTITVEADVVRVANATKQYTRRSYPQEHRE